MTQILFVHRPGRLRTLVAIDTTGPASEQKAFVASQQNRGRKCYESTEATME